MQLKFVKIRNVKSPSYGSELSAGIDLFIPEYSDDFKKVLWEKNPSIKITDKYIILSSHESVLIPSGLKVLMPSDINMALININKSGISTKKRIEVGACVIDQDYPEEIHLHVYNTTHDNVHLEFGTKLVQSIMYPILKMKLEEISDIEFVEKFNKTSRIGGFGSTGVNN